MTRFTIVRKNLLRNKLRTALTVVALAFPLTIFTVVMTLQVNMAAQEEKRVVHLRLATVHRTSLINYLPVSHRKKIEALDPDGSRIVSVCALRWFGGMVPGTQHPITSLAADEDTFAVTYPEYGLTDKYLDAWNNKRNAAVVGGGQAAALGWKEGQRIILNGSVPPYPQIEFEIIRIGDDPLDDALFFRMDYFDEILERNGSRGGYANMLLIKTRSAQDMPVLSKEIDELFRYSPDQTHTVSESAFMESFIQQQGNIPRLLKWVGGFVVFVVSMVTLNTMSMSFRERIQELALFQAIGFRPSQVLGMVLLESLLLTLLAAMVGGVPIWAYSQLFVISVGPLLHIQVPTKVLLEGFGIAAVLGLAAGAGPAIWAGRVPVVSALRRVV